MSHVQVFSCIFNGVSVGGWNALNILSTELFPTKQRGSAFGVLSALGRIAAILGIADIHDGNFAFIIA